MKVAELVQKLLDRITGQAASDERDARLEQVDQRIDAARRQHLRILEGRQGLQQRRQPDA